MMNYTSHVKCTVFLCLLFINGFLGTAATLKVGKDQPIKNIQTALKQSQPGDTIRVFPGIYKEKNLVIDKPIVLLGEVYPVIDGEFKYEIISIKSDYVTVKGFKLQNSSNVPMSDPCAIKVYGRNFIVLEENILENNYFGLYLQYATNCVVKNNKISASSIGEYQSGNGIHCWKSDDLQIVGNTVEGHRDGIYFEFVTRSIIWRNIAKNNQRYGLHFMFSHENAYITNYFKNNGAGVAVMFTKKVTMINNTFEDNWGDANYGVLCKELADCYLYGNNFVRNTTGILLDGSNRIVIEHNNFSSNGWGMRMQANCMDNTIFHNNFLGNTFDIATNGTLTLNHFDQNYWDKYEGYDLDKDDIGDVPFHPLSLYSVIVERNPPAMLLYRSFMITLLDKSEKIFPSLTPENFVDKRPRMTAYQL